MHFEPLGAFDPVFPPNPTIRDPGGHDPSGFMGTSNSVIVDVVGVLLHSGLVGFSLQKSVVSGANVGTAGTAGHSVK